jgi:hypothetical protein
LLFVSIAQHNNTHSLHYFSCFNTTSLFSSLWSIVVLLLYQLSVPLQVQSFSSRLLKQGSSKMSKRNNSSTNRDKGNGLNRSWTSLPGSSASSSGTNTPNSGSRACLPAEERRAALGKLQAVIQETLALLDEDDFD